MNDLRGTQAGHKNSREGTMRDMKALQDKVATKVRFLYLFNHSVVDVSSLAIVKDAQ